MGLSIERELRRAKSRAAQGRIGEAAETYRAILARFPDNRRAREALEGLGPAAADAGALRQMIDAGQIAGAAELAAGLTRRYPEDAALQECLATALAHLGRVEAALAATKRLLDLAPDRAPAWCLLGRLLAETGEAETARLAIGRAIVLDPDLAEAHFSLALVLLAEGQEDAALGCLGRAVALVPDHAAALLRMGRILLARGATDKAALAVDAATRADPALAEAHAVLGAILAVRRNWPAAIGSLARAAELAPDHAEVWHRLGVARRSQGDARQALADLERARGLAPGAVAIRIEIGITLQALGRIAESISVLEGALAIDPHAAAAHLNLGIGLVALGWTEAAIQALRNCLACDPADAAAVGAALFNLSATLPRAALPGFAEELKAAATRDGSREYGIQIAFATAQLQLRLEEREAAMAALVDAGARQKAAHGYRHEEAARQFDRIRATVSGPLPVDYPADAGPVPVFVLGMPRSGTSLTEQILASHSAIHGAGELEDLRVAILRHGTLGEPLTAAAAAAIRADYRQALSALAPAGVRYVVDKMPLNFRWIGHIFAALPEARVIHVRRGAEAVCWSNYRHFFSAEGMAWTFDQVDVARYWKLYRDLMQHWQALFPGRIDELVYEHLTEDQEGESRRLIAALDLPWDPAVLDFHANGRAVRTASRMQVRQKLYRGSSDDWQAYAPWLQPMLEELARD